MPFEIVLTDEAKSDLRWLDARDWACVRDAFESHLRHEPTRVVEVGSSDCGDWNILNIDYESMNFGHFMT